MYGSIQQYPSRILPDYITTGCFQTWTSVLAFKHEMIPKAHPNYILKRLEIQWFLEFKPSCSSQDSDGRKQLCLSEWKRLELAYRGARLDILRFVWSSFNQIKPIASSTTKMTMSMTIASTIARIIFFFRAEARKVRALSKWPFPASTSVSARPTFTAMLSICNVLKIALVYRPIQVVMTFILGMRGSSLIAQMPKPQNRLFRKCYA